MLPHKPWAIAVTALGSFSMLLLLILFAVALVFRLWRTPTQRILLFLALAHVVFSVMLIMTYAYTVLPSNISDDCTYFALGVSTHFAIVLFEVNKRKWRKKRD
jgi:hypothetical protein